MIITNQLNLPEVFVRAVRNDPYSQDGHISVTGLIGPPRIRCLMARHDAEISEDVTDRFWAVFGQSIHHVLERATRPEDLAEERLSVEVGGWTVTGQADLYDYEARTLYDFKTTSVWAYKFGVKEEWKRQLNCYAYLLEEAGFAVETANILMIFKDWRPGESLKYGQGYPEKVIEKEIPLWDSQEVRAYLSERVELHKQAEDLDDNNLPYCTDEERWGRETKYAVMREGRKTAIRVLPDEQSAEIVLAKERANPKFKSKRHYIEVRKGGYARCEGYCSVAHLCNQYQDELEAAA